MVMFRASYAVFGIVLATLFANATCALLQVRDEYRHYKTEPTFIANNILIVQKPTDSSLLQPGYLFIAPFPRSEYPTWIGPQIVDQDGELIWFGNDTTKARTQNFAPCDYLGEHGNHLCFSEATFTELRYVRGENIILDNTYNLVPIPYGAIAPLRFPNPHEFHILPGGESFLNCVYELKQVDLAPYNGSGVGYVDDGCFQEVDMRTGIATFSWCGLDHLELWHTYIYLDIPENVGNFSGERYGRGVLSSPWDYFHINSVDKNEEGDYFISARHLNTIFKIAGNDNLHGIAPGTIIWRLGGKFNDFEGADLPDLSRQHHVNHIETTKTETKISFFNNQWQANSLGRRISSGQIVVLNNETRTVSEVKKYYNPEGVVSLAQGSMQPLPNGNILVGWGTVPHASEFSRDGTVLQHIHFAEFDKDGDVEESMQNYRTYKHDWVGNPGWDPKLLAYSRTCDKSKDSPLNAYVSWNGATEVRKWRFHTSRTSQMGPWTNARTTAKDGFETHVILATSHFWPYVMVEALDCDGNVLATTTSTTWVPGDEIVDECDAFGCLQSENYEYLPELSCAGECSITASNFAVGPCLVLVLAIEILYHAFSSLLWYFMLSGQPKRRMGSVSKRPLFSRPKSPGILSEKTSLAWNWGTRV